MLNGGIRLIEERKQVGQDAGVNFFYEVIFGSMVGHIPQR